MFSKNLLALACSVLLASTTPAFAKRGTESGGGGDASEERVNEIRSDILKWINNGGARGLVLPSDISIGLYESQMTDILQSKKVIVGFVEKDDENNEELKVSVNGMPKTCRGFISSLDSRPHILCNISRFKNTSESEQYKLIHHEFAGLVNIEKNDGAASDYNVSSQITDFLTPQKVLRLAVKEVSSVEKNTDFRSLIIEKWSNGRMFDPTTLGNNLIVGRCFNEGSQKPIAAALAVAQVYQDGGPLGDSADLISNGAILVNSKDIKYFDELKFDSLTPPVIESLREIKISSKSISLYSYDLRVNSDSNIYAVRNSFQGESDPIDVCYFYKQNH